jgi:DNA-binding MarR family transcriptional regulator
MTQPARTANLLGALSSAVGDRLAARPRRHPNENDSSAAALHVIGAFDGCSNVALSQALRRSHPATVRLVDKLERDGLVTSRAGADRRTVSLHLTPAGRARDRAVLDQRGEVLRSLVDVLSPEQRRQLDAIAETLLRAFVQAPVDAAFTCRLCDEIACPTPACPVHERAHALAAGHG